MSTKSLPKPSELLTEAKQFLVDNGWTQKCLARDEEQSPVGYFSEKATCFCSVGAIWRAALKYDTNPENSVQLYTVVMATIDILHQLSGKYTYISAWNDQPERTKEEVLLMFDNAIEKAKENE